MADDDEERRNLSPDSSTQVINRDKRKHRKKKKHRHKSKKRKRNYSDVDDENSNDERCSSNDSSLGSGGNEQECAEDQNELVLDIKPLTEYIDDRKKLNDELFKIMGRKEMKKLMPKSIKKMDEDELKLRCLDQLEVISKKRLLKVLDGQEMSSSSSESEHEEDSKNTTAKESGQQTVAVTYDPMPSSEVQENPVNILEELSLVPNQDEIDELIEGTTKKAGPSVDASSEERDKTTVVDTESQLLELEYRARALKSMVQAQQKLHR